MGKKRKKEWWTVPLYLFRTIWKEKTVDCLEMRSIPFKDYDTLLFVIFGLGLSYF